MSPCPPVVPRSVPTRATGVELTEEEREALITLIAAQPAHCRHYSYRRDMEGLGIMDCGPHCAIGVPLVLPGASKCCWPNPEPPLCAKREEVPEAERRSKAAFTIDRMRRTALVLEVIPAEGGYEGEVKCPCCPGTVKWARARTSKHLWASCSTPLCFSIMQ